MILSFLFYAFLVYLAFKLVFNFIIPVYKTTKHVKKGFREMQEQMRHHAEQYNAQHARPQQVQEQSKTEKSDYIDFEEIK
jgi:hypothetical protein